jgi:arsenite methyltransferase
MSTARELDQKRAVRDRYARAATGTSGCCGPSPCEGESTPTEMSEAVGYSADQLSDLPVDANLGLGCGNPTAIASLREGDIVLDLGSGAGIDCFLASRQVGASGAVIGVDMTPEMLERARANATSGGYTNVEFRLGEIEALPVADSTIDVIISNCVLNLSTDKGRVLSEAFRVLKPGGRIVISDMVSERPVPSLLEGNLDSVAGCLPTLRATYLGEFEAVGFTDVRITDEHPYPPTFILEDSRVQEFLEDHPAEVSEITRFAESISGAHFEATKR